MLRMASATHQTPRCPTKPISAAPNLEDFNYFIEENSTLGMGCSELSVVRVHRISDPSKIYAAKIINKLTTTPSPEARALEMAQGHPNIINLEQIIDTRDYQYIIMELATKGTVMDYLEKYGPVSESLAKKWIRQLTSALQHCCERRIVHMDIKPANLFLDKDLNIKVGDFGLISISQDVHSRPLKEAKGSAVYAAPELYHVHRKEVMALPVLMWAVGVTLHAMLTVELPYAVSTYHLPIEQYTAPTCLSNTAQDFLTRLLALQPEKRLQPSELREHPWLREAVPLIRIHAPKERLIRSCSSLALQMYCHDSLQQDVHNVHAMAVPTGR
ncbi:CAMK/CAMKL protein kinase [Sphaeroforma arctica JP610]|uniref:CAMK/CAMKL protein kinase n=1 Tax=Sphaeroforma arctica JP610 TaxID=667725 RepID=A0A0L0G297_9EUKA|nr:CAMK/CAMKL protein kinase [Sphaeroforma arctica JP610]KNC82318.1 CAMK/CAMKL protein kinase [Sphaeroforma arctica JP610]|eukprot:XP_014156220.1 CAMK/CAMKL protein kinase [Sphaeroforma arctica JP610]